jgi:riboflavin synthase
MFTGIVEERGEVLAADGGRFVVGCWTVASGTPRGASVAVSGVCLTVVDRAEGSLSFDLSAETLDRTSLGGMRPGRPVNLERPVTLASRLGGHLVQGHVDAVGEVASVVPDGEGGARVRVTIPHELMRYVVEKGSIAMDGVSLTIAAVHDDGVDVSLIPHTLEVTALGGVSLGDRVNLEVDMLAKYVERLLEGIPR